MLKRAKLVGAVEEWQMSLSQRDLLNFNIWEIVLLLDESGIRSY